MTTSRSASREFLAIDVDDLFFVMANGTQIGEPMGLNAAYSAADAYRRAYRLAIVKIENVAEFSDWRI